MYCFANICYVCLEKKSKLITSLNSSPANKDIIHIISHLPINLGWLKTLRVILICEDCCLRLRETYQFLKKCLKNSDLLQVYRNNLNTTTISNTGNEAELLVKLNITHKDTNEVKCEIQSEDEEIYTFQWQPNIEIIDDVFVDFEESLIKEGIICKSELDDMQDYNSTAIIEETEDVFVNLEGYFVKEVNTWKREEVDDTEEYPTDNNSTESMDNESDPAISVSHNAHVTNKDCVSSGLTCKQVHATNKNDLNTTAKKLYKCSTCSKSFTAKSALNIHTRIHTGEKPYECAICKTRFSRIGSLVIHMRIHTGEKPYRCSRCQKCFTQSAHLEFHMRVHYGEKQYKCSYCKKCFYKHSHLLSHIRIHTGEEPFSCTKCKKCFATVSHLVYHMRVHTGEKPYSCSRCKKCFSVVPNLVRHLRTHTGEKQ